MEGTELPVLQIGSVLLSPIISGIVELAKHVGVSNEYARFLTGALWVLGFAGMVAVERDLTVIPVVVNLLVALTGFLASTGFYHIAIKRQ